MWFRFCVKCVYDFFKQNDFFDFCAENTSWLRNKLKGDVSLYDKIPNPSSAAASQRLDENDDKILLPKTPNKSEDVDEEEEEKL